MNTIFKTTALAASVAVALIGQTAVAANTVTPALSSQTQILGEDNSVTTTAEPPDQSAIFTSVAGSSNTVSYTKNYSSDFNVIAGDRNKLNDTSGNFVSGIDNTITKSGLNSIVGINNTITSTGLDGGAVGYNRIIGDSNKTTDAVQNVVVGTAAATDLKNTTNQTIIGSGQVKLAYGVGSVVLGTETSGGAGLYIQNANRSVIAGGNDRLNNVLNSFIYTHGNGYNQFTAGDPADPDNQGYTDDTSFYNVTWGVSQGQFNKIKNGGFVTQLGQQNTITTADDEKMAYGVVQIGTNNRYTANKQAEVGGVVQIGSNSTSQGLNNVALGTYTTANIDDGVALGSYATTTTDRGVQGYLADGKNDPTWKSTLAAVSVGDGSGYTRQITSVAAGTADTDAVNVAQLKAAVFGTFTSVDAGDGIEVKKSAADNGGSLYTVSLNQATKDKLVAVSNSQAKNDAKNAEQDKAINANKTAIANNSSRLDDIDVINARQDGDIVNINKAMREQNDYFNNRFYKTEKKLSSGIANAIAIASLPSPDKAGEHHVLFGTGFYEGQGAVALGATGTHTNGKAAYKLGLSYSNEGGFGGGVGGSWRWK